MMLRICFLAALASALPALASDKIDAPADGASPSVKQPHVVAELIPETTSVQAGKPFDIALHLHMDADWHTYWINPGDAGLATEIKWTLPPGFKAGPIQWPAPEKHHMGPLVTYGYGGDVYLLTTITPPSGELPQHFDVKAKATWLVCQEECIPGKAELSLPLDSGFMNLRVPAKNTELFDEARARLPVEAVDWKASGTYDNVGIILRFQGSKSGPVPKTARFFPETGNVLGNLDKDNPGPYTTAKPLSDGSGTYFLLKVSLQQNGDVPDHLSGVLVSDQPLVGEAKAVHFARFPVAAAGPAAENPTGASSSSPGPAAAASNRSSSSSAAEPAAATSGSDDNAIDGHQSTAQPRGATKIQPLLIAVLGAAFVGGLILNLMPCVLPVLSLKVFSLIKHADDKGKVWVQGVAFTAGVVLSFWLLAGALLALRAAGNHLGWGFQMQSPGFVLGLIVLFFLIALNLFGVFEIGSSLVGVDARAAGGVSGSASSFFNGALATLAATPCTAPFMGSALGFAAQQPAFVSMLIFTFLALGMATPYLLLTLFPATLRFVPKPGAWMEAFKQFMGFLLMATVIYLVYVAVALVGEDEISRILSVLLFAAVGAWIYGRWSGPSHAAYARVLSVILVLVLGYGVFHLSRSIARSTPDLADVNSPKKNDGWQPWTPAAVESVLAQGQPAFVDFTAAWCANCKVNESYALGNDAVQKAFAEKRVALFRADWTRPNDDISKALQRYNRDGVPLYLLYSPKNKDAPQALPDGLITPGIVLDALNKI